MLQDFGVKGQIVKVRPGPVVTLYELEPAPGTKTSRVVGLADDVARSMSAVSVRIAVVPGQSVIGIELPNRNREQVGLRELLASEDYERTAAKLALVVCSAGILVIGLFPQPLLNMASQSTEALSTVNSSGRAAAGRVVLPVVQDQVAVR